MSIESKIPTEEIDIKNLGLEQPENSKPFDIKSILTPERIDWLRKETLSLFEKENIGHDEANAEYFYEMAAALKMLDPESTIGTDENTWDHFSESVDLFNGNSPSVEDIRDLLLILAPGKVLFPEKFHELKIDYDRLNEQFALFLNKMIRGMDQKYLDVCNKLWDIKFIFPKMGKVLTESEWKDIVYDLQESRESNSGSALIAYALALKIFRPDLFVELNLNRKDWSSINESFEAQIEGLEFETGMDMVKAKMLAADRIEWTDHGPEAIFDEPELRAISPSIPEVKKF